MKPAVVIALTLLAAAAVAGCGKKQPNAPDTVLVAPVAPPAPGTPGGLPDDRIPLAEGRIDPKGPQGAAQVLQTYFALIEERKYAEAYALRAPNGATDKAVFVAALSSYAQYHAEVGAPGPLMGAAGTLYVDVPVVIYGRLKTGVEVHKSGSIILRRSNDIPGATDEQLSWRIADENLK